MRIIKHRITAWCLTNTAQDMVVLQSHSNMSFRLLSIFLIFLHLILISGCTTTKQSTYLTDELRYPQGGKIIQVDLKNGEILKFDKDGGSYIETVKNNRLYRGIVGVTVDGRPVDIDIDSVLEVRLERQETNVLGTVVIITLAIPAALFAALIVELTVHPPRSCPYVYSFDGTRYVFDAQTYAGAISRALKRTDYVQLDFLKPIDGTYHLILRNDPPNETQYTDELKLLVIDHEPQHNIVFGYDGSIYSVENLQPPFSVVERTHGDVTQYFTTKDDAIWQSELPRDSSYKQLPLRDQLTFAFPKPKKARSAALLIHGGTAYWGSTMIEQLISLRGNRVYEWYQNLQRKGPELKELFQFIEGQELYHLKVNVLEGATWTPRAVIRSGSSLADEYRVIPLDLSNVQGDTLWIRLNPPRAFWKFDYAAISYEFERSPHVAELDPIRAEDEDGVDIRDVLKANDESYHVQEKPKETSKFWFSAPQQEPGTARSLFLKTSGYYIIHTDTTRAEQTVLLQKLFSTDSAGVEYALDEYLRQVKKTTVSR